MVAKRLCLTKPGGPNIMVPFWRSLESTCEILYGVVEGVFGRPFAADVSGDAHVVLDHSHEAIATLPY